MPEPFREPGSVPTGGKRTSGESRESYGQHLPLEMENLTDFVKAEDNPRIKAANRDVEINIKVGLTAESSYSY